MTKRYKKIYGARGLLEWNMALPVGKALVKISFTDGKMGDNGVLAAKYVTDNPAMQSLIEGSHYFRSGKVFICKDPEEIEETP